MIKECNFYDLDFSLLTNIPVIKKAKIIKKKKTQTNIVLFLCLSVFIHGVSGSMRQA